MSVSLAAEPQVDIYNFANSVRRRGIQSFFAYRPRVFVCTSGGLASKSRIFWLLGDAMTRERMRSFALPIFVPTLP